MIDAEITSMKLRGLGPTDIYINPIDLEDVIRAHASIKDGSAFILMSATFILGLRVRESENAPIGRPVVI